MVRSATGRVTVATEPSVLVTSGFEPDALGPAPRELAAERAWRGWDGVVEVLLRRPDARTPVEIVVEDGVGAGVSVGWPAIDARDLPLAGGLVAFALVAAALARRR